MSEYLEPDESVIPESDYLYGLAWLPEISDATEISEKACAPKAEDRSPLAGKLFAARAGGLYHLGVAGGGPSAGGSPSAGGGPSAGGDREGSILADGSWVESFSNGWELSTKSLGYDGAYSATAIAISPFGHDIPVIFLGLAGGLLYSQDIGSGWQAGIMPDPPPVISCLAVSPGYDHDGVILAGSLEDGVLRSADRGRRWAQWNFGLLDLSVMSLAISPAFAEDETVFAGTDSGLFRSTNGGRAWKEVEMPTDFDPVMCLALAPNFGGEEDRHGFVFAGTESRGLFQSDDRGKSWVQLGSDLPTNVQSILVGSRFPEQPRLLVVADGKVFVSNDAGQVWQEVWQELTGQEPATTVLAPRGIGMGSQVFLGMVSGNVYKMTL